MTVTELLSKLFEELLKKGIVLKEFSVDHLENFLGLFHDEKQLKPRLLPNEEVVICFLNHEVMIRENRWRVNYCHDPLMTEDYFYRWRPAFKFIKDHFSHPVKGAEIGVFEGFLSILVLKFLNPQKYILIDPWKEYSDIISDKIYRLKQETWEEIYREVRERFEDYPGVEIIRKPSVEAGKYFKDKELDFVYIDADHRQKAVYEDIETWYPKIIDGGVIAGHDYQESGVHSGLMSYLYDHNLQEKFEYFSQLNDWWFVK